VNNHLFTIVEKLKIIYNYLSMDYTTIEIKVFTWSLLSVLALLGAFYMVWKVYKSLTK